MGQNEMARMMDHMRMCRRMMEHWRYGMHATVTTWTAAKAEATAVLIGQTEIATAVPTTKADLLVG
jgi:hypothetical protein